MSKLTRTAAQQAVEEDGGKMSLGPLAEGLGPPLQLFRRHGGTSPLRPVHHRGAGQATFDLRPRPAPVRPGHRPMDDPPQRGRSTAADGSVQLS